MRRRFSILLLLICLLLGLSTVVSAKDEVFPASAGSSLTGLDKIVYDRLSEGILEVASGERTEPIFSISMKELGLDGSWTAKDLGVNALFVGSSFSQAAKDALYAKLAFDDTLVVNALLADYPFDLYWFNKTMGFTVQFPACTSNGRTIWFTKGQSMTIQLAVCQEYARMVSATSYKPYQLDPASLETFKVEAARAEALRIVRANADKSDYEKLAAYRDAICDAVSYNHTAAGNPNYPYGNPWQPISVFDGNPRTNVVCEGYAKAFKYLCDLTDFDGDIHCYLVDGWSNGGTGAGAHMWNVVAMPDGETYLVDVTNCDEGSIGHPDWMFLAGDDNDGSHPEDCVIVVPQHPIDNGYISLGGALAYTYNQATRTLWDEDILEIEDEDYTPPKSHSCGQAVFTWKDDLSACTVSVSCLVCGDSFSADCQVTSAVTAGGKSLTVTASGTVAGQKVTDKLVIKADKGQLKLPVLVDEDTGSAVQVLVVGYESCGKLVDYRMAQFTDGTVDLSGISCDSLRVFFPTENGWTPILPPLTAK